MNLSPSSEFLIAPSDKRRTQMKLILLSLASLAIATNFASADIGIVSVQEAKKLIENSDTKARPVVLDTRGGYKDYFRGHLPTAHHFEFDTLRGTDNGVPVQYLPPDLTKALLLRAGADKDRLHLIYATGAELPNDEVLSASLVAFVLEKYGIRNIKVVDGGLPAWKAAGFAPTQEYFGNPPGHLPGRGNPEIALKVEEVLQNKGKPGFVLVDARPKNEYLGQDETWLRKGHIPGAISFHWARLMEKDNTHKFKPFAEVKAELEAAGITPDKQIMCYCGTSREGSLLRFYLKHVAGYPNVRLYEGAWKEYVWLKDKSLPAETTEPSAK
ncbi:MAG: Rhodanese domain protein [Chthoniobacteraceae bacterium]|nr:Rhodanese domain protein [Chthoniobacteraceae bacterium]